MDPCAKVPHQTLNAALAAMAEIRRHAPAGRRVPTGAYWCPPCRQWHLTSHGKTTVPTWLRDRADRRNDP